MKIFDSHAHYDDRRYDGDRDEVLDRVYSSGVGYVLNIGSNLDNSRRGAELASHRRNMWQAVGVHPHDTERTPEDTIRRLEGMLELPKVIALGEIGLDFYYDYSDREVQRKWFRLQMELAERRGLPVVIHDREAHGECLDMVREFPNVRGVFHCYAGSAEMARELIKLGYYLSFGGIITFKNARRSHESLAAVPLERLLVETDCPYLAPEPHRGERNDSSLLPHVIAVMAGVLNRPEQEIIDATARNALALFGITDAE